MPRADKHCLGAELHHQGGVGRRGDAPGREVGYRQLAVLGYVLDQLKRRLMVLGGREQLVLRHDGELLHLLLDGTHVTHGLDNVARPGFALGANHRRAFANTPQRLTQISRTANEGNFLEGALVDVVRLIGRGEHFALVDVVDTERFENPTFHESDRCGLSP